MTITISCITKAHKMPSFINCLKKEQNQAANVFAVNLLFYTHNKEEEKSKNKR